VDGPHGWKIHGRRWPAKNPRSTLVGVHGYSEHSGRYSHLAEFLNSKDVDVFWIDLPGHGLSEGARNNIDDFNDYVVSLDRFVREVERMEASRPLHLFGHSLGGLVSIRLLQQQTPHSLQSLILSGPLLGLDRFDAVKMNFLRLLTSFFPNIRLRNKRELSGPYLTRDESILKDRAADPLINTHVTFHWFREFCRAHDVAWASVERIHLPVLMLLAGDERVVSSQAIQEFFKKIPSVDKRLIDYPEMKHEVVNELGRERVFEDIASWISSHG